VELATVSVMAPSPPPQDRGHVVMTAPGTTGGSRKWKALGRSAVVACADPHNTSPRS